MGEAEARRLELHGVLLEERHDVDAVVAMLAEDARMAMPPRPTWFAGRDAVAAFLARRPLSGRRRWRLVPMHASGQLAFGHYVSDESSPHFRPHGLNVLTLEGDRIAEITAFLTPEAFPRFGLPVEIR